jgi:RNA polymerase sigma factor (sigma-70 family)
MPEFKNKNLRYPSTLEQQFPQLNSIYFYSLSLKYFLVRLHQFKLVGRYQPAEIMAEVICRLYCAVRSGKTIYNLEAWVKRTGLNYIYELSRVQQKEYSLIDSDSYFESVMPICDSNQEEWDYQRDYAELRNAMQLLSHNYQEILEMRYFQSLSWEKIAQIFAQRGEQVTTSTLRKRGQRALEALRIVFLQSIS